MTLLVLGLLGAYLVGSIPFGIIVGRGLFGVDPRTVGSGNIGAANSMRALGPLGAALVLLGDVIKGVATDAVRLVSNATSSKTGLTLQVVEISRTTHFPVRMLGYAGATLVRKIDFSQVKLQPSASAAPSVRSVPTPIVSPSPPLTPTAAPTGT